MPRTRHGEREIAAHLHDQGRGAKKQRRPAGVGGWRDKQATFLVLVRNVGTIRKQQSLSSWLHGVAARIAHKTWLRSACQRTQERVVLSPSACDDPSKIVVAKELRAALDEEIERLPAKYRTPLVLCYLADKTHEQAARELGWPKSSVTSRLARARELLQRRLRQRGR